MEPSQLSPAEPKSPLLQLTQPTQPTEDAFNKEKAVKELKDSFDIMKAEYEQANITILLSMKKVCCSHLARRVESEDV